MTLFRTGLLIGVLAAAVVALVIVLVVSNDDSPTATTTVTNGATGSAAETTTATATASTPTTSTTSSSTPVAFLSPSGNIICKVTRDEARCGIAEFSYQPPRSPASCVDSQGWGHVVGVQGSEAGEFVCADDQPAEPSTSPVLSYGRAILVGRMVCASSPKGVRCTNRDSRHGFQVSREQVQLF